jgi:hypothetical protein
LMSAAGAPDEDTGAIMGHTGSTVTAENYIDRDFRRLAGVVARHPLTFRGGAGVVRTADRPAQAIAVNARELIEFARSRGEARPWPCSSGARLWSDREVAKAAELLLETRKPEDRAGSRDHAHKGSGDVCTVRERALAFAALEWRGSW